ncbi:hypothetical protein JZO81_19440 [Enterococcus hulanensis]|uniref:hypothetical protein n=1 Tax=Enterococcus TaxID=1350 RepID=UPI000B5A22DD|nr:MULTISPECIES: hypothetical protein [Enterococcus]MBO0413235.1 hypothetical protein [Enterococcus hulanensis]OTO15098.1 hypothetical protein A5875_004255 [Enterococcus sp. 3H8_DIV0648]
MLETKQSISLTGESVVEGQRVIYMNANISEDQEGSASISQQISSRQLYNEHKDECRKDIDAFTKKVREIEDSLATE